MKKLNRVLTSVVVMAVFPCVAGAAGTYYNGNLYRSPQYKTATNGGGYYNNYGAGRGYGQEERAENTATGAVKKQIVAKKQNTTNKKQGFLLDVGLSKEMANWQFKMSQAGSKLHYDNLDWVVLNGEGAYYFDTTIPTQLKVGALYGKQMGETTMVDDDITSGAYSSVTIAEGTVQSHAMSLGTSKDGSQYGFNVEFGLTDFWKWGNVKVTPSVGYRYFKYELETSNGFGMSMDTLANNNTGFVSCISSGGETQCDPYMAFFFYDGNTGKYIYDAENNLYYVITGRDYWDDGSLTDQVVLPVGAIPAGATHIMIDMGDSYYYSQMGATHKYKTQWAGPYLALDFEYNMSQYNFVSAGIEFGLPIYKSEGDQPYRIDWMHPKSVEDKGEFGDAYHLGLNAEWVTTITDSFSLSFGVTYDYYKVAKADASTYLNPSYYKALLDYGYIDQDEYDSYAARGWTLEAKDEIESIYKSMGLRVGANIKF